MALSQLLDLLIGLQRLTTTLSITCRYLNVGTYLPIVGTELSAVLFHLPGTKYLSTYFRHLNILKFRPAVLVTVSPMTDAWRVKCYSASWYKVDFLPASSPRICPVQGQDRTAEINLLDQIGISKSQYNGAWHGQCCHSLQVTMLQESSSAC